MERFNNAEATIYQDRIVCGKCGFMVAKYKIKPEDNENENGVITVLCRRRDENGEVCNTLNEIKV